MSSLPMISFGFSLLNLLPKLEIFDFEDCDSFSEFFIGLIASSSAALHMSSCSSDVNRLDVTLCESVVCSLFENE